MFAPQRAAPGGAPPGLGLSMEELRSTFREFDLDKNGHASHHLTRRTRLTRRLLADIATSELLR
jgi:hypothetical protein